MNTSGVGLVSGMSISRVEQYNQELNSFCSDFCYVGFGLNLHTLTRWSHWFHLQHPRGFLLQWQTRSLIQESHSEASASLPVAEQGAHRAWSQWGWKLHCSPWWGLGLEVGRGSCPGTMWTENRWFHRAFTAEGMVTGGGQRSCGTKRELHYTFQTEKLWGYYSHYRGAFT